MNSITVRNIPDKIQKQLKRRSKLSRRSLNSEILACLEEALFSDNVEVEDILKRSEEIRNKLKFRIDLKDIQQAKQSGRI